MLDAGQIECPIAGAAAEDLADRSSRRRAIAAAAISIARAMSNGFDYMVDRARAYLPHKKPTPSDGRRGDPAKVIHQLDPMRGASC